MLVLVTLIGLLSSSAPVPQAPAAPALHCRNVELR